MCGRFASSHCRDVSTLSSGQSSTTFSSRSRRRVARTGWTSSSASSLPTSRPARIWRLEPPRGARRPTSRLEPPWASSPGPVRGMVNTTTSRMTTTTTLGMLRRRAPVLAKMMTLLRGRADVELVAASGPTRHFTVGEVGNHRSQKSLWVLVENERMGFDVYDVTLAGLESTSIRRTERGLEVGRSEVEQVRNKVVRLGGLLQQKNTEEVRENDGRGGHSGRPLWITMGFDIYDITHARFSKEEMRDCLISEPGGNPTQAVLSSETLNMADVLEELGPYRCGIIRRPAPLPSDHALTRRDVAWYAYPETGMYVIIRNEVYDVGGECGVAREGLGERR